MLVKLNAPQELKYWVEDTGIHTTLDFKLKECKDVAASSPTPPADYKEAPHEELQPIYEALAKLGPSARQPKLTKVIEDFDTALNQKNYLDALLITLEYSLSTGDQMTREMAKLKPFMDSDPESKKFLVDYGSKNKQEEVQKALDSLDSIDRKKLSRAYVIDVMKANDFEALKQFRKARELEIAVLTRQPLLTGMYHDLGVNYQSSYEMNKAWDCFDLADKIMPDFSMMKPIHELDARMETTFPDFFLAS